jgi:AbrB family looped-hinge helix DNA binding protein
MATVKVSPKFQVVIPKQIREQWKLKPGEELQMFLLDRHIHLRRPRSIKERRGMPKAGSGRTIIVTVTTASEPVVVYSSGWLAYFTNDAKADLFAPYLERRARSSASQRRNLRGSENSHPESRTKPWRTRFIPTHSEQRWSPSTKFLPPAAQSLACPIRLPWRMHQLCHRYTF